MKKTINVFLTVLVASLVIVGAAYALKGMVIEKDDGLQPEQPIGGQRDEHGCLGPAGYSWLEEVGACGRNWELDENQRQAAKIAVDYQNQDYGLTVIEVLQTRCPGCWSVDLEELSQDLERTSVKIQIDNWEVIEE